jgi:hypothetical protein
MALNREGRRLLERRGREMSIVVRKTEFTVGVILTLTFFIILFVLHSGTLFGIKGKSLVDYTDEMFVSVSKGSVYFIPQIIKKSNEYVGRTIDIKIKGDEKTAMLFEKANASVELEKTELKIKGDLGEIQKSAAQDADLLFNGEDKRLQDKYGFSGKEVIKRWWTSLKAMEGPLRKAKKFEEIELLSKVRIKALEPAFNYYGVEAASAGDYALGITSIVVCYVLYTVWWGFAIYFLCEGVGLLVRKGKEKKEA